MTLNTVFTSIRLGLSEDTLRLESPCRWSIPVHFRQGKRHCERNDRSRVGVERRKKPCCTETGPRSIGYLVGNININDRNGPSTSLRYAQDKRRRKPFVLSVRRNAPEVEGRTEWRVVSQFEFLNFYWDIRLKYGWGLHQTFPFSGAHCRRGRAGGGGPNSLSRRHRRNR